MIPLAHAGAISDAVSLSTALNAAANTVLGVAGTIALISLVISGLLYIAGAFGGNNGAVRAAKKSMTMAVIGIVILLAAVVVLRTIASLLST